VGQEAVDLAILQAREAAQIYTIPCEWYLSSRHGDVYRICRKRHANRTPFNRLPKDTHTCQS
jgi:hypothetical protein